MNNRRQFITHTSSGLAFALLPQWLLADSRGISPRRREWLKEQRSSNEDVLAKARADIKLIRMSDAEIQLLNTRGKPLANMPMELVQKKHHFNFGDCNPEMDKLFRQEGAGSEKLKHHRHLFAGALNTVNATCYWTDNLL